MLKERVPNGVYNYEFIRLDPPILRAASRIDELRKMGFEIICKRVKKGVFKYTLIPYEKPIIERKSKQDALFR